MNAEPFLISPQNLGVLGGGNPTKGRDRVKLLIAAERDRKPIAGPTEKPPNVRFATSADEPALEELLAMDAAENSLAMAPLSLPDIQDMIRLATRAHGLAAFGVIDDDKGNPIATVGLFPERWWWSSVWYLRARPSFVHPDHRDARPSHAQSLVLFARHAADQMSADLGHRVYLLHDIAALSDTDPKLRLLGRMSNYGGSFFCYPAPPA